MIGPLVNRGQAIPRRRDGRDAASLGTVKWDFRLPHGMARGPTAKCPFCRFSLSSAYAKVPRSGKIVTAEGLYVCRKCGATVHRGSE